METHFDKYKYPKIRLTVGGMKKTGIIEAILDTGFDGFLSLPITIAVSLGLELTGVVFIEYADGRRSQELVFAVRVSLNGKEKIVSATLTASSEALAGTVLFADYELRFNFAKQTITAEKIR